MHPGCYRDRGQPPCAPGSHRHRRQERHQRELRCLHHGPGYHLRDARQLLAYQEFRDDQDERFRNDPASFPGLAGPRRQDEARRRSDEQSVDLDARPHLAGGERRDVASPVLMHTGCCRAVGHLAEAYPARSRTGCCLGAGCQAWAPAPLVPGLTRRAPPVPLVRELLRRVQPGLPVLTASPVLPVLTALKVPGPGWVRVQPAPRRQVRTVRALKRVVTPAACAGPDLERGPKTCSGQISERRLPAPLRASWGMPHAVAAQRAAQRLRRLT